jgi:hypothetical protein
MCMNILRSTPHGFDTYYPVDYETRNCFQSCYGHNASTSIHVVAVGVALIDTSHFLQSTLCLEAD